MHLKAIYLGLGLVETRVMLTAWMSEFCSGFHSEKMKGEMTVRHLDFHSKKQKVSV